MAAENEVRIFGKWSYEGSAVSDISLEDFIAVRPKDQVYLPHTAGRYQVKRFRKALCPIVERLCNALMRKGRNNGKKVLAIKIMQQAFELIHLLTDENPMKVCFARGLHRDCSSAMGSRVQCLHRSMQQPPPAGPEDCSCVCLEAFFDCGEGTPPCCFSSDAAHRCHTTGPFKCIFPLLLSLLPPFLRLQIFVQAIINAGPREDSTRVGAGGIVRRQAVDVAPFRRVNQAIYLIGIGAREASFRTIKSVAECLADEIVNASKGSSNSYAIKKKDEIERVAKANR